jgi:hypothetical protein
MTVNSLKPTNFLLIVVYSGCLRAAFFVGALSVVFPELFLWWFRLKLSFPDWTNFTLSIKQLTNNKKSKYENEQNNQKYDSHDGYLLRCIN